MLGIGAEQLTQISAPQPALIAVPIIALDPAIGLHAGVFINDRNRFSSMAHPTSTDEHDIIINSPAIMRKVAPGRVTFRAVSAPRRNLAIDERGYASWRGRSARPTATHAPEATAISLIVVHGISLPPGEFGGDGITRLFTNRLDPAATRTSRPISHLRVSAHFLIRRDGELVQFVGCLDRAWHAGLRRGRAAIAANDFSIGIELEGTDAIPYAPAQYTMLARLISRAEAGVPDRGHRRPQRHRPGRKDRPRPGVRLGRLHRLLAPRARKRSRGHCMVK
jgi:AmpD protein